MRQNKLIRFLQQIRNLGISDHQTPLEQERIRLINDTTLFGLLLEAVMMLSNIVTFNFDELIGSFLRGLLLLTFIAFNYFKNPNLGRIYFSTMVLIAFGAVIFLTGISVINSTFFILFPGVLYSLLPTFQQRIIFVSLTMMIYLGIDIYGDLHPPEIIRNQSRFSIIIGFGSMLTFGYLFFTRLMSAKELMREQLKKQSETIQKNNQVLETNQQKIEQQQLILERTNKELEQFAYIASHDLKTPLRNISSFLSLIKRKLKDHPNKSVHEYLTFASGSAKQMHFLVEDILEYSRLGNNNINLNKVNVSNIIEKVKENISSFIDEKNGQIIIENELPEVFANETQVTLLFQNLIENGLKYNKSERPTVKIKNVSTEKTNGVTITDNGLGIPEEYVEKVFNMFERLHGQGEYQGSGVGLAICKKIVEQYNGTITIEKNPSGGSIFKIEVPKPSPKRLAKILARANQR